jgi:hypothetical protein
MPGYMTLPETVKVILLYIGMNRVNTVKTVQTAGAATGKKASFTEIAVGAAVAVATAGVTNDAVRAELGQGLSSMGTSISNVATGIGEGVQTAYDNATSLFKVPDEVAAPVTDTLNEMDKASDAYTQLNPDPVPTADLSIKQQFTDAVTSAKDKLTGYWNDAVAKYDDFVKTVSGVKPPGADGATMGDIVNKANTFSVEVKSPLYVDGVQQYAINPEWTPDMGADAQWVRDAAGQKVPLDTVVVQQYKFTDMIQPLLDVTVIKSYQQELVLHKQLAQQQATTQAELQAQTAALKAQEAKVDAAAAALHAQVDNSKATYAQASAQEVAIASVGQASVALQDVSPEYYDVVASTMKPDTLAAAKMMNTQQSLNTITPPTIETPRDPTTA